MATNSAGRFKQTAVEANDLTDSSHIHALTMGDITFLDIDGKSVFIPPGSNVVVNLERMVACNDAGVHFAIFKDEFIPVTFN